RAPPHLSLRPWRRRRRCSIWRPPTIGAPHRQLAGPCQTTISRRCRLRRIGTRWRRCPRRPGPEYFPRPRGHSHGTHHRPPERPKISQRSMKAERARRAAAMRTGQWRRRGVEERNGRLGEASTTVPASQKTWSADELRPQYAEQAELVASILNRRPDDLV